MKKLIALAGLACVVAGPASAQTPAQKLVGGTWVCVAVNDGMQVISKQSYTANGGSEITLMVFGQSEGVDVRIAAEGVGTWNFLADRLDEKLSVMTATFAEIGGEPALDIAQDLLDSTMVGVQLSNTATFDGPTLLLIDDDSVVTNCVR